MSIRSARSVVAGQAPITAAGTATVLEASVQMKRQGKGALLVLKEGRLAGIVTERDIVFRVVALGRDAADIRLDSIMTPQPQTIHPDKPFLHALRMMREGGFRHLPVVENGRPLGIVSARDALDDDFFELRAELAQRGGEEY